MNDIYLEVTYRGGEVLAAYIYLPRRSGDRSARVERRSPGLLLDVSDDGRPIGIEIAIPSLVSIDDVNATLVSLGLEPMSPRDLSPLSQAA